MERTVIVCGAGLMGHGIAQVLAAAGATVRLYEPELSRAEAGLARIRQPRPRRGQGRLTPMRGPRPGAPSPLPMTLAAAATGIDLAVEAARRTRTSSGHCSPR
jgi:3-hydroxyacyl-CoA dehydrogenase